MPEAPEETPAEMIARLEHQLVHGPQGHPYRAISVIDFTRLLGMARLGLGSWVSGRKSGGLGMKDRVT